MIARVLTLLCLLWLAGCGSALAEKRVALIVGNGAYPTLGTLPNSTADARSIGELLAGPTFNFQVITAIDADHTAMLKAMADFGNAATDADIALVFYAGHGIQIDQRNYLLPVSANIRTRTDLPTQAIKLDDISEILNASGAKAKILIIDACRNNPLPFSATRSASRGLARLDASVAGMLIAFATGPGDVAADGAGAHSPFTSALLQRLPESGLEIRQALARVRADVYAATDRKQTPWVDDALLGELYLAGKSAPASVPIISASSEQAGASNKADMAACTDLGADPPSIKLEAYLDNFPQGYCAVAVRRRLDAMTKLSTPTDPPAPPVASIPDQPVTRTYAISSYWNHNGSLVALSASDENRLFYYETPRAALSGIGVQKGALLFKGEVRGGVYRGLAFLFSRECGPISYPVEGSATGEPPTITLRGRAPKRAKTCAQVGWREDTLVFRYDSKAN